MTMISTPGAQLGAAVWQKPALSVTGALERLFARLFRGLVYVQIWEDPVADMKALALGPGDDVVCIASGGCNALSYLTAGPASVLAVDLSPAHVALVRAKLAAARQIDDFDTFYALLGRASGAGNRAVFRDRVLPALDPLSRAFWTARSGLSPRYAMFDRGAYRHGVLGRFLGAVRLVARLGGVDLAEFLACRTQAEQVAFYETRIAPLFDTRLVRALARRRATLFGLGIPPAQYDKLAADGGGDVIPVLRERVRKLMCDFPLSDNYFARQAVSRSYDVAEPRSVPPYLDRANFGALRANADRALVVNRSVTDVLADAPAGSKSKYVLLDAQDWMTDAQLGALWAEITRTARPGARVIFRTGGAEDILPGRVPAATLSRWRYDAEASATGFAADRSAIYGGFHVYCLKDAA